MIIRMAMCTHIIMIAAALEVHHDLNVQNVMNFARKAIITYSRPRSIP